MKSLCAPLTSTVIIALFAGCAVAPAGGGDDGSGDGSGSDYGRVEFGRAALCFYENGNAVDDIDLDDTVEANVTFHGERADFDDALDIDCAEEATMVLAIETFRDSWWVAYGVIDAGGIDATPLNTFPPTFEVELVRRQIIDGARSASMALYYDNQLMGALEASHHGLLLEGNALDDVKVTSGTAVGQDSDGCGTVTSSNFNFSGDLTFSLSPFDTNDLTVDGSPYYVASIANLIWDSAACASALDYQSWALWYEGDLATGSPF